MNVRHQDHDTRLLALHGFSCAIPAAWESAVNKGDWYGGFHVLSAAHVPRLAITWDRGHRSPDFDRSLTTMTRRMLKEHAASLIAVEPLRDGRGLFARYRTADDGDRHVAIVRPKPDVPLVLVLRQLSAGGSAELRDLLVSTRVHAADGPVPWAIHGLSCVLPGRWRLVGIHNLVGLQRAVWFHHSVEGKRADGVLVLRRYACASRLLGEQDLAAWIAARLAPGEIVLEQHLHDGLLSCRTDAPGATWWRRLKRRREIRHLHAWIDEQSDRLMLQESKGDAAQVPALRPRDEDKTAPFPEGGPECGPSTPTCSGGSP